MFFTLPTNGFNVKVDWLSVCLCVCLSIHLAVSLSTVHFLHFAQICYLLLTLIELSVMQEVYSLFMFYPVNRNMTKCKSNNKNQYFMKWKKKKHFFHVKVGKHYYKAFSHVPFICKNTAPAELFVLLLQFKLLCNFRLVFGINL